MSKVCEKCMSNTFAGYRLYSMSLCASCYRYIHAKGWKPERLLTKCERACQWCNKLFTASSSSWSDGADTFCSSECFIESEFGAPFG